MKRQGATMKDNEVEDTLQALAGPRYCCYGKVQAGIVTANAPRYNTWAWATAGDVVTVNCWYHRHGRRHLDVV